MKVIITAKAATGYQLNSLGFLNMDGKQYPDGSYRAWKEFKTRREAGDYLRTRAKIYNDKTGQGEKELREMLADIRKGYLTMDAVTAYIEEIHEEGELPKYRLL